MSERVAPAEATAPETALPTLFAAPAIAPMTERVSPSKSSALWPKRWRGMGLVGSSLKPAGMMGSMGASESADAVTATMRRQSAMPAPRRRPAERDAPDLDIPGIGARRAGQAGVMVRIGAC